MARTTARRPATPAEDEVAKSRTAAPESVEKGAGGDAFTLNLPMVTIRARKPELPSVRLPDVRRELGHAVDIARTFLPPPERMVYYGGLAALAAVGVIDWPVAAAIGVGTIVVQRARQQGGNGESAARGRREAASR
ncbi:hypothetical protein [Thermocatellispora tengchongensis]|nr:hypothetical protein [Thermocatellispora tengchongensis]